MKEKLDPVLEAAVRAAWREQERDGNGSLEEFLTLLRKELPLAKREREVLHEAR